MRNKKLTKVMAIMAAVVFTLSGTVTAYAVESPGNGDSVVETPGSDDVVIEEGTGSDCGSSSGGSCTVKPPTPTDVVVDSSKIPATSGAIAQKIAANVTVGERVTLGYVGTDVSASIFEKAKETGAKITLYSDEGTNVVWHFGLVENSVDFKPGLTVARENEVVKAALANVQLTAGTRYKTVSFKHHGMLPAPAEVVISFNQDAIFQEGDTLYMYYCNPETNTFEYVDSAVYQYNVAQFSMTHCSDYIVTTQPIPTVEVSTSPKTGDGINYGLYVVILVSALGLAVVSMKKKNA